MIPLPFSKNSLIKFIIFVGAGQMPLAQLLHLKAQESIK